MKRAELYTLTAIMTNSTLMLSEFVHFTMYEADLTDI